MLALVAPYEWSIARFFAESLTAPNPDPVPASAARVHPDGVRQVLQPAA